MIYYNNTHNLSQPNKSYKEIEQILKEMYQMDKTPNNQPTIIQNITPNAHNL